MGIGQSSKNSAKLLQTSAAEIGIQVLASLPLTDAVMHYRSTTHMLLKSIFQQFEMCNAKHGHMGYVDRASAKQNWLHCRMPSVPSQERIQYYMKYNHLRVSRRKGG